MFANQNQGENSQSSANANPNENEKGRIITAQRKKLLTLIGHYVKMILLLALWIVSAISIIVNTVEEPNPELIGLSAAQIYSKPISGGDLPKYGRLGITLSGAISEAPPLPNTPPEKLVKVEIRYPGIRGPEWVLVLAEGEEAAKINEMQKIFKIDDGTKEFQILITTGSAAFVPLHLNVNANVPPQKVTLTLAFLILVGLYVLIIWDIVDRAFAALIASTTAIAVLGWLHMRPSMETIVSWIDYTTIVLLFGMMILVAILSDTGIFDYLAVVAYKVTRGHPWPMIFVLCTITGLLSAFLDNVTMMLLMTPVTIRLCEIMGLNVQNVLISVVIFSNIGGTMTAVGDPPNIIISSNKFATKNGVTFMSFLAHMMPIIIFLMITTMIHLYFQLGKSRIMSLETEAEHMKRQIKAWEHAKGGTGGYTEDEKAVQQQMEERIKALQQKYREKEKRTSFMVKPVENFHDTLAELEVKYPIKNKVQLYKSLIALTFVVVMFFLHSVPMFKGISLPWAAVLAALLLFILAGIDDITSTLLHVEWATLLFFAALFVLMEALSEMGLIDFIGEQTVAVIGAVNDEGRLPVAVALILWISGITSAFVDNIPITTMMIKLVVNVYRDTSLNLPFTPLVWALALGACLGGNGTLIGASANVVCAGIAEQHGYRFGFWTWFKIGFPVMLANLLQANAYLLLCHTVGKWH